MATGSATEFDQTESGQSVAVRATPATLSSETMDGRLTTGRLSNVTVDVIRKDMTAVSCAVRAVGSQEVVLIVPRAEGHLEIGEVVTFSLCEGDAQLFAEQSGIVHWSMAEGDTRVVALFSGSRLDLLLNNRLINDRRTDIRYPVDLQAFVRVERCQLEARVVNYSLHGLCLASGVALEANRHYQASVICDDGSICLSVFPKWITQTANGNLTGCGLKEEHGVMLTRRHSLTNAGR
jgi:hypothetical protein